MHTKVTSVVSDSMNCSPPGPTVHRIGFSSQECWSVLPILSPENFPDPGIKPMSLVSCTGRQVAYH